MIIKISLHVFKQKKRINLILFCTILFLFLSPVSYSQEPNNDSIKDSGKEYFSREKVYLHFDKPYYTSGDDIWFKVYLVNGYTNKPTALSKIVYVDLIDMENHIIASKVVKISNGGGTGDFKLDLNLNSGQYMIRAYTNFMRNFDQLYFFRKTFKIHNTRLTNSSVDTLSLLKPIDKIEKNNTADFKPDIQFLPEGGYMVNGLQSRIGYKAIGENGRGIDIEGSIIDNEGNKIIAFKSGIFGMGRFNFIPENGKYYKARINSKEQELFYDLPLALDNGITMQIVEAKDDFHIYIQSTLKDGVNNLSLTGKQKGQIVCNYSLQGPQKKARLKISKMTIKHGLLQFSLIDKSETIWSERLVFVDNDNEECNVKIESSKNSYMKRDLVEIQLSLDRVLPNVSQTDMSVSITDFSVIENDINDLDIKSHFLLNANLKGEIESPGYYFNVKNPQRKRDMDILLMTQGWRRFLLKEEQTNDNIIHNIEEGISFQGTIKKYSKRNETTTAEVSIYYKNTDEVIYDETKTDQNGRFVFNNFHFYDSTEILIQAKNMRIKKEKKRVTYKTSHVDLFVELDSMDVPPEPPFSFFSSNLDGNYAIHYAERSNAIQREDSIWAFQNDFTPLDEVELLTVKKDDKYDYQEKIRRMSGLYVEPNYRLDLNDSGYVSGGNNIFNDLIGRVPGLSIQGDRVNIRSYNSFEGENEPLFLLDNMPVDYNTIKYFPVHDIHFVDVIMGVRAAIYGTRGAQGVIAVYTRDGTEQGKTNKIESRTSKGFQRIIHTGYYKAREFYEPKYIVDKPEHQKPDYRSTLYWKPNIQFDDNGKAKIYFYTADIQTSYRVDLQGITSEGIPLSSEAFINIE